MKPKNLILVVALALTLSGCVVFSFYPLYTSKDLFANDLLTGEWVDNDSTIWKFEHRYNGKKIASNIDSTSYILTLKEKKKGQFSNASLRVVPVKLGNYYFLDFYLEEYLDDKNLTLFDFHILPVHTFAKLEINKNNIHIRWFNQEWLKELIQSNRIRIHHENNDEHILLTAKPEELQKFVIKYINTQEAFKDGIEANLKKLKK